MILALRYLNGWCILSPAQYQSILSMLDDSPGLWDGAMVVKVER